MGRAERDIDPTAGPIKAFAADLRRLRQEAGSPTFLAMARSVDVSRTALSEASGGDQLPTWKTVEGYVRACGGDTGEWRLRWEHVSDEVAEVRRGATGTPSALELVPAAGPDDGAQHDDRAPGDLLSVGPAPDDSVPSGSTVDTQGQPEAAKPARGPRLLGSPRRRRLLVALTVVAVAVTVGAAATLRSSPPTTPTLPGAPGSVTLVSVARLNPDLLMAAGPQGVTVWNIASRRKAGSVDSDQFATTAAAFDPLNRDVIAVGGADGVVRIYDMESGRPTSSVGRLGAGGITAIAFDPDNRYVLAVADTDGIVTVWDYDARRMIRSIRPDQGMILAMTYDALTPNTLVLSGSDGRVTIWDSSNGQPVRALAARVDGLVGLAFDPLTRNTLVTGEPSGLRVWDSSNGNPVRSFGDRGKLTALAFNPLIRNSLASGHDDGDVRIWDASTGRLVHLLHGESPVMSLAYSPDGRILAVAGADGDIRLWPVKDWR